MMRLMMMLIVCAGLCLAAGVTGTAGGGPGGQHPIEKGTVEADQITIEARPGPTLLKFVMKQQGDKLSGEVFEDGQRIGTISLDRVKQ